MQQALPALEACDAVYRYAWYSARNQPGDQPVNGGSSLLEGMGALSTSEPPRLTSTGEIYRTHALAMRGAAALGGSH